MAPEKKGFVSEYKICDDVTIIYLTNKKGKIFELLIDTEDLQKLIDLNYCWHTRYNVKSKTYYADCSIYIGNGQSNQTIMIHRFLTKAKKGDVVDHINHNGLDNRKSNLKLTTNAKNSQNRLEEHNNSNTGHLNVSYIERDSQYWVQFMKDGHQYRWIFSKDQFEESCAFATAKRKELFGE